MTELGRPTTAHTVTVGDDSVVLDWAGATDVGRRRAHNEDSLLAESPFFVVADGMGGHSAGDVASDAVVRRMLEVSEGATASTVQIGSTGATASRPTSTTFAGRSLGRRRVLVRPWRSRSHRPCASSWSSRAADPSAIGG